MKIKQFSAIISGAICLATLASCATHGINPTGINPNDPDTTFTPPMKGHPLYNAISIRDTPEWKQMLEDNKNNLVLGTIPTIKQLEKMPGCSPDKILNLGILMDMPNGYSHRVSDLQLDTFSTAYTPACPGEFTCVKYCAVKVPGLCNDIVLTHLAQDRRAVDLVNSGNYNGTFSLGWEENPNIVTTCMLTRRVGPDQADFAKYDPEDTFYQRRHQAHQLTVTPGLNYNY